MKKIIAIILMMSMIISISACSLSGAKQVPTTVETSPETTGSETEKIVEETVTATEIPEVTKEPVVTPAPPVETPYPPEGAIFTNDDDYMESAKIIKSLLEEYTDNVNLICAIMGMLHRESKFYSYRVAHQRGNSFEWTKKIDEGLADGSSRDEFIDYTMNVSGGYGLAMWVSLSYLNKLYDYAQEWGTSIGDARMQCSFLIWDIENNFPELYKEITTTKSVSYAGEAIGRLYERTADYVGVGGNTQYYYNLFYKEETK